MLFLDLSHIVRLWLGSLVLGRSLIVRIRAMGKFIAISLLIVLLICGTGVLSLAASSSLHPCQCDQTISSTPQAYSGCCCGCCGGETAYLQDSPSSSPCNCSSLPASPLASLLGSILTVGTSAIGNGSLNSTFNSGLNHISTFNLYQTALPMPCARLLYLLHDATHAPPSLC